MRQAASLAAAEGSARSLFDRPVCIISPPRSGSTLLFETMAQAPGLYSVGGESHGIIEQFGPLAPRNRDWESNRLAAADAAAPLAEQLARAFYERLRDRDGNAPGGPARMLEKTPKNALRIPFFDAMWPDCEFVYLYRDPRRTLSSMIEAWSSGRFRTYPRLPDWTGHPWSLLLVPGWRQLSGLPLPHIVAEQWRITTDAILDDLSAIPRERVRAVMYDDLVARPQQIAQALASSLGLGWDRELGARLPLSRYTVSQPSPDKWRANEEALALVMPLVEATDARARAFAERLAVRPDG